MDKRDFFVKAMQEQCFKRKDWVISAFSVFREEEGKWKEDPYPYRIVMIDGKHFFVDPDNDSQLTQIKGTVAKTPAFAFNETLEVKAEEVPNLDQKLTTTYGRLLFNYTVLIWPFKSKVSYVNTTVNPKALEAKISERLVDDPEDGNIPEDDDKIYVSELLRYGEAVGMLAGFTQLCVPAASERTIKPDPEILKRRDELVEQYKDQLNDPAIVAKIEKELVDMYNEKMKGDPAEGFFVDPKTAAVRMKKSFIMHGYEAGFGEGVEEGQTITTSLDEGWQIDKIPAYVSGLRSGSYSRGSQTELGGEAVKNFHRVFQNTEVAEEDCGVKHGLWWKVTDDNIDMLVGQYELASGKPQKLDHKSLSGKKGSVIEVRSPMLCKTKAPSFCAVCMGEKYGRSPTGLGVAAAEVGSTFMGMFMAAMHGKELSTAPLRLEDSIT